MSDTERAQYSTTHAKNTTRRAGFLQPKDDVVRAKPGSTKTVRGRVSDTMSTQWT
jgi:hypothetical protein